MTRPPSLAVLSILVIACSADPAEQPVAPGPARVIAPGTPGTPLGTLGGLSSYAADINDAGTVVGWSNDGAGVVRPFRWSRSGGMTDLGVLEGDVSGSAIRILNSGKILGTSTSAAGRSRVVEWTTTGRIAVIPIQPPRETRSLYPADFNQRGEVVGGAIGLEEHGWYWSRATGTIDLRTTVPSCLENGASAINAQGMVAGTYCAPGIGWVHAFAWRLGRPFVDLGIVGEDIGSANAVALSINGGGTIGGWIDPHGNGSPLPYRWRASTGYTLLPIPAAPYPNGAVNAVSDNDLAVGSAAVETGSGFSAVAWPDDSTLVLLDDPAGASTNATAVNNRGLAVGYAAPGTGAVRALIWRISQGTPVAGAVAGRLAVGTTREARREAAGCHLRPTSKGAMMECVMRGVGSRE